MSVPMLDSALAWHAAGYSIIPIRTDGTKAPSIKWDEFKQRQATPDEVTAWFGGGHPGIGVVCGSVSGNLEMFEFEGRAVAEGLFVAFNDAMQAEGAGDLLYAVANGYAEQSPSGGIHFFYRVSGSVDGNTKLAQREARDDELTDDERDILTRTGKRPLRALIETRGEGGQVVVAPSHGPVHHTGNAWFPIAGDIQSVVTITPEQRDLLHGVARTLDQRPAIVAVPETFKRDPDMSPGDRHPGEDYNERADWREILEPLGWTPIRQQGERVFWRRPGKKHGVSAVTGGGGQNYLFVWTTSTELPAEEAMSPWRVYARLHHREDYSAAARELRRRGYGSPLPEQHVSDLGMFRAGSLSPAGPTTPPVAGTAVSGVSGQRYETPVAQGQPQEVGRFAARLFTRSELALLPKPQPLIADTLDLGTVTLLAGGWGSMKSFVVQDWSSCVASDKTHWGTRSIVRHGRVLYVASEGAHGLDSRLTAWEAYNRLPVTSDAFVTLSATPNLSRFADVAELYEIIATGQYTLVVIDTLAKCMSGLDENSAKEMGVVLEALYKLREATGDGLVIAVHHTGKSKQVRGSSALEAGVDTVYMTDGNADAMTLRRTKRKDGATEDEMNFRLHIVDGTDSAVIVDAGQITMTDFFGFGLTPTGNTLLEKLLDAFNHEGIEFSNSEMQRLATGGRVPLTLPTFYRARKELLAKNVLIDVSPGRTRSTRFRLQRPVQDDQGDSDV